MSSTLIREFLNGRTWPSKLPEQVRAVAQLLSASPSPLGQSAIVAGGWRS